MECKCNSDNQITAFILVDEIILTKTSEPEVSCCYGYHRLGEILRVSI